MCIWYTRVTVPLHHSHCHPPWEVKVSSSWVCITKTEKAESEAQRGKPKGTLESESRNAIL